MENKQGLLHLNNTHGLHIKDGAPISLVKKTIEWLSSKEGMEALSNQARYYCGGMWKLEPKDVEGASLPSSLF
jgi:hypothetical protein